MTDWRASRSLETSVYLGCGDVAIQSLLYGMLIQGLVNSIVAFAILVLSFALTGGWPPLELMIGSSIGGALSPLAWQIYRNVRPHINETVSDAANDSDTKCQ